MAKAGKKPKTSGNKKIVLFADGTGNSAASPHKTNVWRAYKALDISPLANQHAFYDDGVGTNPFRPLAIIGLTLGWGLAANVRQLYGKLCRIYKPGDKIYIFGFSRGAFTARVLAALITSQGVINYKKIKNERDLDRLVLAAYRRFRKEAFTPSMLSFLFAPIRDTCGWLTGKRTRELRYQPHLMNYRYCTDDSCRAHRRYPTYWHWAFYQWNPLNWFKDQPACSGENANDKIVEFLGVWDTVDAYGGPIDEMTRAWDKVVWPLQAKDRVLSSRVKRAYHALSLDEQRLSFEPMLWDETYEPANKISQHIDEERITQVWFSGVHANVGGGYPDDSLAHVSLDWIMDKSGLKFIPEEVKRIKAGKDSYGPIYDNRAGMGNAYRYQPRNLDNLSHSEKPGLANWIKGKIRPSSEQLNIAKFYRPKVHRSVFDRIINGNDGYAPINLPKDYVVVDKAGNVSPPPESSAEIQKRKKRQGFTWNKVWLLKFLHLLTLASVFTLVVYPYWTKAQHAFGNGRVDGHFEILFGTMSGVLRSIPEYISKVPGLGFIKPWSDKWADFPVIFLIFVIAIAVLIGIGLWVNSKVKTEMRRNWFPLTKIGAKPHDEYSAYRRFWKLVLTDNPFFERYLMHYLKVGIEAIFVLVFIILSAAVISRIFFVAADGFGFGQVCYDQDRLKRSEQREKLKDEFDPKLPCMATGYRVSKGENYRIKMQLPYLEEWKDKSIEADLKGWINAPWYMYPATILRRHLAVDWYQPVARVDTKLYERYPLSHVKEEPPKPVEGEEQSKAAIKPAFGPDCSHDSDSELSRQTLCMKIMPRQDGHLFLYLNDAVLFHPRFRYEFYSNNEGKANFWIEKLESK